MSHGCMSAFSIFNFNQCSWPSVIETVKTTARLRRSHTKAMSGVGGGGGGGGTPLNLGQVVCRKGS